jgi:hypothetical protein
MNITWDFLFSYWLFIWFLIYYILIHIQNAGIIINFIKTFANPIIGLVIASVENVFTLVLLIYKNNSPESTIKYLFAIVLFKLIPIYLLKPYTVNIFYSFISFLILFIIYLIYVKMNNQNIVYIYQNVLKSILANKNDTPFFKMMSKISDYVFW